MNLPPSARTSIADLQQHFANVVLPLWAARGFNDALGLPYDAIAAPGREAVPVTRYRAMACARQLYVFSAAGQRDHADRLFESLRTRFADTTHGGWFYSIDAQGAPRETTKDLYTHAFVIFACAEYFKRGGNRDALDVLEATLHIVETRFGADAGLYNATLSDDFRTIVDGPLQNPIMHLTEAYLTASEVLRDTWFTHALRRIGEQIVATFVHRPTGCIAELPIGTDGNRIEPGHQFEWFYLVSSAPAIFSGAELPTWLACAYRYAQQHGVSPTTGGVCAALDEAGRVIDPVERIWAQTEYARALATWRARADHVALPGEVSLDEQLGRLRQRFLRDYGWVECIAPDGGVVRADMPSTTPYHLMSAYLAIAALEPERG